MISNDSHLSLPSRIILHTLLNITLVWVLGHYMPQYFTLTGGITAAIIVGSLLTLLNIFVRPLLSIITFPLRLFATILAIIIVNGVFVQLAVWIIAKMQPNLVTLEINGGLWGWVLVALIFGMANWAMRQALRAD